MGVICVVFCLTGSHLLPSMEVSLVLIKCRKPLTLHELIVTSISFVVLLFMSFLPFADHVTFVLVVGLDGQHEHLLFGGCTVNDGGDGTYCFGVGNYSIEILY